MPLGILWVQFNRVRMSHPRMPWQRARREAMLLSTSTSSSSLPKIKWKQLSIPTIINSNSNSNTLSKLFNRTNSSSRWSLRIESVLLRLSFTNNSNSSRTIYITLKALRSLRPVSPQLEEVCNPHSSKTKSHIQNSQVSIPSREAAWEAVVLKMECSWAHCSTITSTWRVSHLP